MEDDGLPHHGVIALAFGDGDVLRGAPSWLRGRVATLTLPLPGARACRPPTRAHPWPASPSPRRCMPTIYATRARSPTTGPGTSGTCSMGIAAPPSPASSGPASRLPRCLAHRPPAQRPTASLPALPTLPSSKTGSTSWYGPFASEATERRSSIPSVGPAASKSSSIHEPTASPKPT